MASRSASAGFSVSVSLVDFGVIPTPPSVAEGGVTFDVTNNGEVLHNLRVIQTDLAPDALPMTGDQVNEGALTVVASSPDLFSGGMESLHATLSAGNYVLICNLPGHYGAGMRAAFSVIGAPVPTDTPGAPTSTLAPGETPQATPTTLGAITGPPNGYGPGAGASETNVWLLGGLLASAAIAIGSLGALAARRAR